MIKSEIYKLIKIKVLFIPLFIVIGTVIYSMLVYGEFGYDLSKLLTVYSEKGLIAYSEKDGELLSGQDGYEHNKEVAANYAGEVNDIFLEKLHFDFNTSSYVEFEEGIKFFNSTYSFFQDVFNIESDNYAKSDEVWGNADGSIRYGFTGDWDAFGNILNNFFMSFSIFVIVLAAPLFTYDRECSMSEILGTVKNGGIRLFKYKAGAAFLVVNIMMFILLAIICIFHFSQYGFANADVSIQCSFDKKYVGTVINCTMGQLTVCQLLFGIIGCNMILLVTIFISMLNQTSLAAFAISIAATWAISYPVMKNIVNNYVLNLFLSVLPVNAFYITALICELSTWNVLWGVFVVQLALFLMLFLITVKVWRTNLFITKRD